MRRLPPDCCASIAKAFGRLIHGFLLLLLLLLSKGVVEYLGIDLGELFDSAGLLLPSDFLYYDDDDDDDAASTASGGSSRSGWGASGSAAGPGGAAGGQQGSVRDLAAVMMFQPRRLQRLKRRYEQLLRIALQVRGLKSTFSVQRRLLQAQPD